MILRCSQYHNDVLNGVITIVVPEGMTLQQYAEEKALSAERNGWTVQRVSNKMVVATKVRWVTRVTCRRVFEVV